MRRTVAVFAAALATAGCSSGGQPAGPRWPDVFSARLDGSGASSDAFQLDGGQAWLGGPCSGEIQDRGQVDVVSVRTGDSAFDVGVDTKPSGAAGVFFRVPAGQYTLGSRWLGDGVCHVEVRQQA